jgi:hypothetical protein
MQVEILLDAPHFDPALAAELADALRAHFAARVVHQPTNGTPHGPRVVVTLPLTELERLERPVAANLLSRPLYRSLDAHVLRAEPRPPIEFRFRFVAPERTLERRVTTNEPDVLKHAVDTLLEQLVRPEPVLAYDERTGGWGVPAGESVPGTR